MAMGVNGAGRNWIDLVEDGGNLEVEDFLSMRLAGISTLIHRNITRLYLAKHGLSLPEWRMLSVLVNRPPIAAHEVNSISRMDKGQISRALALLAAQGLVDRSPDAADGRRQMIAISRRGKRLFARILPDARRSQAELLRHLSVNERKVLRVALDKLAAAAQGCGAPDDGAGSGAARPAGRHRDAAERAQDNKVAVRRPTA